MAGNRACHFCVCKQTFFQLTGKYGTIEQNHTKDMKYHYIWLNLDTRYFFTKGLLISSFGPTLGTPCKCYGNSSDRGNVLHSRLGGKVHFLLPEEFVKLPGNLPLFIPQLCERRHELRLDAVPLVLRFNLSRVCVRHTVSTEFVVKAKLEIPL